MSRCESIIHPLEDGGCPSGNISAGACYCDCHSLITECIICDESHQFDDMVEVRFEEGPAWVCDSCYDVLRTVPLNERGVPLNGWLVSCSLHNCACGGDEHMPKVT